MPGAWNQDEPRRRREDTATGPAVGGSGVASGLGAELGVPPTLAGADAAADPAMAGAKPAMMGVYDRPERRFGGLAPLLLLLVVIAALLALGWALFAGHSEAPKVTSLLPFVEEALRLAA
jgi:hypothetical protein